MIMAAGTYWLMSLAMMAAWYAFALSVLPLIDGRRFNTRSLLLTTTALAVFLGLFACAIR